MELQAHWGLQSTISNKPWPQARLRSAGLATSSNCSLCVALGYCDPEDPNPAYRGTLLHRLWICRALEDERVRLVPSWLLTQARSKIRSDYTMSPADLLLYTRALIPSCAFRLSPLTRLSFGSKGLLATSQVELPLLTGHGCMAMPYFVASPLFVDGLLRSSIVVVSCLLLPMVDRLTGRKVFMRLSYGASSCRCKLLMPLPHPY